MAVSATGRLTADEPVVRPGSVTGARTGRDRAGLMAGAAAMEPALPPWSLRCRHGARTAAMEPHRHGAAPPPWSPRCRRAVRRARSRDIGEKGATDPSAIWRPFPIVIVSRLLSL